MDITNIGTRGVLFTFDDLDGLPTCVYLINGENSIYVLDTFLGPHAMKPVKAYIREHLGKKPVVVFNSHYHWDHVWGNCAFPGSQIVAHELCFKNLIMKGQQELERYEQFQQGPVIILSPNVTFSQRLNFEYDSVEFYHTPGHTADSASAYDYYDHVLFVGDNVEAPLPCLNWGHLAEYRKTLQSYLQHDAKRFIAGHHPDVSCDLIRRNLRYVEDVQHKRTKRYLSGDGRSTHLQNMQALGLKEKPESAGS